MHEATKGILSEEQILEMEKYFTEDKLSYSTFIKLINIQSSKNNNNENNKLWNNLNSGRK